jgi:hypothetical protein
VQKLSTLRRIVLFGAPFLLGLLELGHLPLAPGQNIVQSLTPIAPWWTALHVAQIPLFALLGWGAFMLAADLPGRSGSVARSAAVVFSVLYPAFDAAVGVSSGVLLVNIGAGSAAILEPGFQALFWGPVTGSLALIASASWLVTMVSTAIGYRATGASTLIWILLGLSGLLLGVAHIPPFGPLGCLAFLTAAALIEFGPRNERRLSVLPDRMAG